MWLPVVFVINAAAPTAILEEPIVFAFNAYDPKAVLLIEVVVNCKAFEPTAVLFEFVFATNVLLPIATFCEPDTLFCKAF